MGPSLHTRTARNIVFPRAANRIKFALLPQGVCRLSLRERAPFRGAKGDTRPAPKPSFCRDSYIFSMMNAIDALEAVALSFPWPLLWLGACLGHAFILTVGLNALYAWPLPRSVLKVTRKIDVLFILSAPLIFFISLDVLGARQLEWHDFSARLLLAPY